MSGLHHQWSFHHIHVEYCFGKEKGMSVWKDVIPAADKEIYQRAGFGNEPKWGGKPALLIIDALWSFVGHKPVGVLEAIEEYPTACGKPGWDGLEKIAEMLGYFRATGLPVIYVCADGKLGEIYGTTTHSRKEADPSDIDAFSIPEIIAPIDGEPVIIKSKASAFFRTSLDILLYKAGVDMVLIAGSTTSGCIRASAVDAFSSGFETILLEDAVWDRSVFSHSVSLFELSQKYAGVATVNEAIAKLAAYSYDPAGASSVV